jgi:hypothetical protein
MWAPTPWPRASPGAKGCPLKPHRRPPPDVERLPLHGPRRTIRPHSTRAAMSACKHALIHLPTMPPRARRGCARHVAGLAP